LVNFKWFNKFEFMMTMMSTMVTLAMMMLIWHPFV